MNPELKNFCLAPGPACSTPQTSTSLPSGGDCSASCIGSIWRRAQSWRSRSSAAVLSALLVACGGGGGADTGGDTGPPILARQSDNFFPLTEGAVWVYSRSDRTAFSVYRLVGPQTVGPATGVLQRETEAGLGSTDETAETVYLSAADGVREYAPPGAPAIERVTDGIVIMPWPSRAGDSLVRPEFVVDNTSDFDSDGRADSLSVRPVLTVVGLETVSTPAGVFADSLRQREAVRVTVTYSSGLPSQVSNVVIESWYAPGVGLVKQVVTGTDAAAPPPRTELLTAYRVGPLSSDLVSPTVQSVSPSAAATRGPVMVMAELSEAIDPASVTDSELTVHDSDGVRLSGAVRVRDKQVFFEAGANWASGQYTARLSGAVKDLVGNRLGAPREWGFTVDVTAPGLVSASPANQSRDVPLDSAIVLTFSEAVNASSLNATSVQLFEGANVVAFTVQVEGSRATIRPTGGMKQGTLYTLNGFGITDVTGNPLANAFSVQFTTTQGSFAFPELLFADHQVMDAVWVDLDGDGLSDLVATTQNRNVSGEPGLHMRKGMANGELGPVVALLDASLLACSPRGLVAGDFNGDGRTDLVVSSAFCNAQVLLQGQGAVWTPGQLLDRANGRVVVADINGDGLLDVMSANAEPSGELRAWMQNSNGQMVGTRLPSPARNEATVKRAADLNRDGRLDLVVSPGLGFQQDVEIWLQQADGSFAAGQSLSTASVWGASDLAVGDLNGDGRIDIVASTGGNSPTYVAVFYQGAAGLFGPATALASFDNPSAVRLGDLNGDGRLDMVVAHTGFSRLGVYLQLANGLLSAEQLFSLDPFVSSGGGFLLADINRDGRVDILFGRELIRQLSGIATPSTASGQLMPWRRLVAPTAAQLLPQQLTPQRRQ